MVVLTLMKDRPMYGYEILKTLSERGNGEFEFKQGTLYPVLYRLEREGWIKADWEIPETGKKRKVYKLTKDGDRIRKDRHSQWKLYVEAVNSILLEVEND